MGEAGSRIDVLRADYRELTGRFDKVVSIEMFEAVGLNHYDDYFKAVDRLLAPDGAMLLQTITVDDQCFRSTTGRQTGSRSTSSRAAS
jgi:cyclopropane-fatty-acyl-phospholipid synthase